MKRFSLSMASLVSAAFLAGCAGMGVQSGTDILLELQDAMTGAGANQPAIMEVNGQPAVLYASQADRIVFKQGETRMQIDETARVKGGNRFQLHRQDNHLHALWWSHEDGKNVYFTSSGDKGQTFSPVAMVNDVHGILAPFSLLRGSNGEVAISYLDERAPRTQAYINRSTDYGRTWPRPDQRLDIAPSDDPASDIREPQSVEAGTAWVSAWVDVVSAAGRPSFRIVTRRSDDAGKSWSEPKVLFSSDKLIASLAVKSQGKQVMIAADEHDRGIFMLASHDEGRNWDKSGVLEGTSVVEGSEGASNNGIQMTVAGERAYLVWMQDRKDEKTKIMRATLDITQGKWLSAAERMDVKNDSNTRSMLPVIATSTTGSVFAAWVDYRDIRPNIYVSASFDQGQSWTAPKSVLQPGNMSAGWPMLMPWKDQVALGYETYPTDDTRSGKFTLRQIALNNEAKTLPEFGVWPVVSEAERKLKLQERVTTFWQNRVAGNYQPTYDVFDFAYKKMTPEKTYLDGTGNITYLSYNVGDIAVNGNEASVKMKIKFEVKPTTMPSGRSVTIAPLDVEATHTWVWVGNNWYFVYSPSFGKPNLSY